MEQEKALQVLVEVALVAQAKGVLSLDDAVVVKQAIDAFKEPQEQVEGLTVVQDDKEQAREV